MTRALACLILLTACSAPAQNGLDQAKWLAAGDSWHSNQTTGYCFHPGQISVGGGILTETTSYTSGYSCQGHTMNYLTGLVLTNPAAFSQPIAIGSKIQVVAQLSGWGVHSAFWMWGGLAGTAGYPANCYASIASQTAVMLMGSCMDAGTSYEIDGAEMIPNGQGVSKIGNNLHRWTAPSSMLSPDFTNSANPGLGDLTLAFHTYEVDINASTITYYTDGVLITTVTYSLPAGAQFLILLDTEADIYAANPLSAGLYPISTQFKSVQVKNAAGDITFSDSFPGSSGALWFGIP